MNRCQHCDRACANRSSLKRHISAKHPSEAVDHGHTPMRYQCPHCHADFQRRETVRRHVRRKHQLDLSVCSFCLEQRPSEYLPQHRATCARNYWRKVQQHKDTIESADIIRPLQLISSDILEQDNVQFRNENLSKTQDKTPTVRIFHENTFDARLAADALTQTLPWFEKKGKIESYKAALVTALCLNITFSAMRRSHTRPDSFDRLYWLARNVSELVQGFSQINDPDYHTGETILHKACDAGVSEILEPLFWKGACFDAINKHGWTPLDRAIRSGDINTIRYALALGSDPNRNYLLLDAYLAGRHDIMTILVDHGADIDQPLSEDSNATLLSAAIERSDLDMVRLALSFGADPNVAHPIGDLISKCLAQECLDCVHEEMACLLVEKGADVSRQHYRGQTVFHYAATKTHVKLLRAALNRISSPAVLNIEDFNQHPALHYAIEPSDEIPSHWALTSTSMLLEAGADVNVQDVFGDSTLILVARQGLEEFVRLLLDAGADVNVRNLRGESPLTIATRQGSDRLARLLLDAGADINAPNACVETVLILAAEKGNDGLVRLLLDSGAFGKDIDIVWSALLTAVSRGHATIVRYLLERTLSAHNGSAWLTLALGAAVRQCHGDIVKDLLLFGADLPDVDGLAFALEWSSSEVVHVLLEAGARFDCVASGLLTDLFVKRNGDAQELDTLLLFQAPAKRELLIRAFPEIRSLYT